MQSTVLERQRPSRADEGDEGTPPVARVAQIDVGTIVEELDELATGLWATSNGTPLRLESQAARNPETFYSAAGIELIGQRFLYLSDNPRAAITDDLRQIASEHGFFIPQAIGTVVDDFKNAKTPGVWLDPESGTRFRIPKTAKNESSAVGVENPKDVRYVLISLNPNEMTEELRRAAKSFGLPVNF
jgi:hypothetical protein